MIDYQLKIDSLILKQQFFPQLGSHVLKDSPVLLPSSVLDLSDSSVVVCFVLMSSLLMLMLMMVFVVGYFCCYWLIKRD